MPSLGGNTLILADMSGLDVPVGSLGERARPTTASWRRCSPAALALRAERATLVQYGSTSQEVQVDRSKGVLEHMGVFQNLGGTQTMEAVRKHFRPGEHTRVMIVTDEQAHYDRLGGGLDTLVPEDVHVFTWNLGGYRPAHAESSPTRHSFGGLTDQSFRRSRSSRPGVDGELALGDLSSDQDKGPALHQCRALAVPPAGSTRGGAFGHGVVDIGFVSLEAVERGRLWSRRAGY